MKRCHRDDLYMLRVERSDLHHFIRTLLRLYNGIFTEFRPIDEAEIATWSGYTAESSCFAARRRARQRSQMPHAVVSSEPK